MITLITGVPGSGKTLYAIKLLLEMIDENKKDHKKDPDKNPLRTFFADINELDIDGVDVSPEDWRDTPTGSVVLYDECQEKYGPEGKGRSEREDIRKMEKHRHTGHDLILITQRESLLHPNVRALVGRHYHIKRQFGTSVVKIFRQDEVIDTKSHAALGRCDLVTWTYDKRLFGYYKSSEQHTHKAKIPFWLKTTLASMFLFFSLAGVFAYTSIDFFTGNLPMASEVSEDIEPSVESEAPPVKTHIAEPVKQVVQSKPEDKLNGCVVWNSGKNCRCYNVDGSIANLTVAQCKIYADRPTVLFHPQQLPYSTDRRFASRATRAPSVRKQTTQVVGES